MKKLLLLIVLAFALSGCDGKRGHDGNDGINGEMGNGGENGIQGLLGPTGPKGCDFLTEIYDEELGFCRAYTDAEQALLYALIRGADGSNGINGTNGIDGVTNADMVYLLRAANLAVAACAVKSKVVKYILDDNTGDLTMKCVERPTS